jgi:hypothetical protein
MIGTGKVAGKRERTWLVACRPPSEAVITTTSKAAEGTRERESGS